MRLQRRPTPDGPPPAPVRHRQQRSPDWAERSPTASKWEAWDSIPGIVGGLLMAGPIAWYGLFETPGRTLGIVSLGIGVILIALSIGFAVRVSRRKHEVR